MTDEPIERASAPGDGEPDHAPDQAYVIESVSGARGSDEEDERYRGATPPGYDWPTHGGYLGCLLGVMIACLLAPLGYILFGFVGAFLVHPLGGVGVALAVIITVAAYLAVFVALSRLGWYMGKRFLREYEQPSRPVWGEDDDEEEAYPLVVDADPPTTQAEFAETSPAEAARQQNENAG